MPISHRRSKGRHHIVASRPSSKSKRCGGGAGYANGASSQPLPTVAAKPPLLTGCLMFSPVHLRNHSGFAVAPFTTRPYTAGLGTVTPDQLPLSASSQTLTNLLPTSASRPAWKRCTIRSQRSRQCGAVVTLAAGFSLPPPTQRIDPRS